MNEAKTKCDFCHEGIPHEPITNRGNKFCDQSCAHFFEAGIRQDKPHKVSVAPMAVQKQFELGNE